MTSLKSLQALLAQMSAIEGTTEGGRHFRVTYTADLGFNTQIFDTDGAVYEPILRMHDVIENNILSTMNKIDEIFFEKRKFQGRPTRTQRKKIHIIGSKEDEIFAVQVKVENSWVGGRLYYKNQNYAIDMDKDIPDHIHLSQRHDYLFLHYQKPENWKNLLEFSIKDNYYQCCGNNILGTHMYCFTCGKKQEVKDLRIDRIEPTELLTLLT
jgi:hypothetical protein